MTTSVVTGGGIPGQAGDPCPDCEEGPSGIAGHDRLFSHTMFAEEMHFNCRDCGRFWARRPGTEGTYAWSEIGSPTGPDTPGRSGMTPP